MTHSTFFFSPFVLRARCALALVWALGLVACVAPPTANDLVVSGEATYRERMLLPPGAVLEVIVEDSSRADAPAQRMASVRQAMQTSPTPFELKLPRSRLNERATYTLRARVVLGEQLLMVSDTAIVVPIDQPRFMVNIALRRTGSPAAAADVPLQNTRWRLLTIDGTRFGGPFDGQVPHLILNPADRRASGFLGCNRFTATYELTGAQLKIGRVASTLMACAGHAELERAFAATLTRVQAWSIAGNTLTLKDDQGRAVATLEAEPLR